MITIIDYGMGNLRSVANAFEALGTAACISSDPRSLKEATAIVLPGVGAFGDGMRNLRASGFVSALEEEVRGRKKPFLGMCLGLQLLAKVGQEHGEHEGLGWIDGVVDRLPVESVAGAPVLRLPHIGWNEVRFCKRSGLFSDLGEAQSFYFVHSFALRLPNSALVSGLCTYGGEFVASIEFDNISATQFHPEKSHRVGLSVIRNWTVKACSKSA